MRTWTTQNGYVIRQLLSGRSNVFLLSYKDTHILIDTSTSRRRGKLRRRIEAAGIQTIDYLILTHTHNDHAANAYMIREKYHARVIVHRNETNWLAQGLTPIPRGTYPWSRFLVDTFGDWVNPYFQYTPCPFDISVDDFFDLSEFGFNAYLLHTPGHSCGSLSIIIDDEIALVGDLMLGRGEYYTYPPFADEPVELLESWQKLLDTNCRLFIPSHGYANTRQLVEKVYKRLLTRRRGNSFNR